jgi:hypothetical protein
VEAQQATVAETEETLQQAQRTLDVLSEQIAQM